MSVMIDPRDETITVAEFAKMQQQRDQAIKMANRLAEALKDSQRFIGIAHCSGYKCRLPHCDCCTFEEDIEYPNREEYNAALAAYEAWKAK